MGLWGEDEDEGGEESQRIARILRRLGLYSPERAAVIELLLDDQRPNAFAFLAAKNIPFSAGARTRHLLDGIAEKLGRTKIDREQRDYIFVQLREVGILRIGLADSATARVIPDYWKPKSSNCLYLLDPDFRRLLASPADEFDVALELWARETDTRFQRIVAAEDSAFAREEGERLVSLTIRQYCRPFLPGYEVVYVDDYNGPRLQEERDASVKQRGVPLDLGTRWPDIILHNDESDRFWVVDCVETDGEIDVLRHQEIEEAFQRAGLTIEGFTTAYRTLSRFSQRQQQMNNLAPGTYVWILEIGGAQFLKQALERLPRPDPDDADEQGLLEEPNAEAASPSEAQNAEARRTLWDTNENNC